MSEVFKFVFFKIVISQSNEILTVHSTDPSWPFFLWQVNAQVVHRNTRQRDADPYEGVDRVTVERNDDQEQTAYAVDDWKEQGELKERRERSGV